MSGPILDFVSAVIAGRSPSRRALAAAAKLKGYRLERRWPYVRPANAQDLDLQFEDVLELQRCRTGRLVVLVVGAFDGATNDPTASFISAHECRVILVEPQPGPFARLTRRYGGNRRVTIVNAAIDEYTGTREFFTVADTLERFQFNPDHIRPASSRSPLKGGVTREASIPDRSDFS